jgi:hypothetical protein
MEMNNVKEFILEFFKDCKIKEEKGVLTISGVPHDFEELFGKKSPYKLVFDVDSYAKIDDSELITQGCYFLTAIRDYFINKGQTSLSKLNIKLDLQKLNKDKKFKNSKILKVELETNNFLKEFNFLSICQYLNDKKQLTNKFLVKDNQLIDLDMKKFSIVKGNKEQISIINLEKSYDLVKRKLDLQIKKDTKGIILKLNKKLEKEIHRIKDYYSKQIKEKDEEIEKCGQKIKLLENKVKHTFYDRDIDTFNRMIRESKVRLEMLKKKNYKQRLKTEENFHLNDEIEKNTLSIKNILINVTIYYYPIYTLSVLKNGKKSIVKYDPLFDKII